MIKHYPFFNNKQLYINLLSFLIFSCLCIYPALAQEEKESISFLLVELESAKEERKIDILNELALRIENTQQAKKYAGEALSLAQGMNYSDGIASALVALGELHKYTEHIVLPTDSLDGLAKKYQTSINSMIVTSNLLDEAIFEGQVLKIQTTENAKIAEDYFLKALEVRKKQAFRDGQVWVLLRLASFYEANGNMDKAEQYFSEIVTVREAEIGTNPNGLRNALTMLANFYYKRTQNERVPSEKAFFMKKEDEIREKILGTYLTEKKPQEYLSAVINLGKFYWEYRQQINKAEKYFKKGVALAKEIKNFEHEAHNALWEFYKMQGKRYFGAKDFDLADQSFKKYIQTVKDYYAKNDTIASHEIANAYLLIADFYKGRDNLLGREIYTMQSAPFVLASKNQKKFNWLKDRLLAIYSPEVVIDSLAKQRSKELYSEDFKDLLKGLPSLKHAEIKALILQKIMDYGSILGSPTMMTDFYNRLIQNPDTEIDNKLRLYANLIEVLENQEHKNEATIKKYYQEVFLLAEPIKVKNNLHYWYLAKVYFAMKDKPRAIDAAWKSLQNVVEPNQPSAYLMLKQVKEAQNILAELLKFDEVTDSTFIVHTVEKEETLDMIQAMYQVSATCLKEWNFLMSGILVEGMKIKVCKKKDWVRSKQEEQLPANTPMFHTVNRGETLESIARKYGKTVAQIQAYNANSLTTIILGQKILVGRYFMQCGCID